MTKDRSGMTVHVVSLASRGAGDSRMGGTGAERIASVAELTAMAWAVAKRPRPEYTRSTMPVRVTTLADADRLD